MNISRQFNQSFIMLISFFFLLFAGETGAFSIPVLQYLPVHSIAWKSSHYIYEPESFVPALQAVSDKPIVMHKTPDWSERDYKVADDPLWTVVPEAQPFTKIGYYHCDHLGTPQEITDEEGNIAWSANYKAWGEAKEVIANAQAKAGIKNPLRFQGQYFDHETGLHYNRFRYYDPETGRFISRDPIGLTGGLNIHQYAANPVEWVDPLGLKYKSKGIAPNVKTGKDHANKGTNNLSEWRRVICRDNIAYEREKFLGEDFVKVSEGKWRSKDGLRQMRVTPSDYRGAHGMGSPTVPNQPHVHFEFLQPTAKGFKVVKNVHVPLAK